MATIENESVDLQSFLQDPKLVTKVNNNINAYNLRPAPPKGMRYRHSPEDELIAQDNFNAMYMIDEFVRIVAKQSSLSKRLRDCISAYVVNAIQKLYKERLEEKKKEAENGNKEESGN